MSGGEGGEFGREYRFVIPVLPPSVNALHQIIFSQKKVELKPEVRRWQSDVKQYVPRIALSSSSETIIRIDTCFYYPFRHANGKMRIFDTQNGLKPLIDVIAAKVGFNDLRAKAGSWDTVDSKDEKVEVTLREVLL